MRRFRIFLSSMFSFLLLNSFVYALDNPHDASNSMTCSSCHFTSTDTPPWFTQPPDPENPDTNYPFNRLCWSCHNDTIAPYRRTHSNFVINGVEGWTQECRTCHNPHYQRQFRKWGSSSYLYSGTSTSVTPTTITRTGAGWTDNQWQGMVVIGNTSYPNYNYRILSNTSDTLTVQGTINTTYVKAGNTFAIVYGRLVKDYINSRYVRFFRNQGSNSFADGDTTYDGVCEVCHTQTVFHRRDGSDPGGSHFAGAKCTMCHSHTGGFGASGSMDDCISCHKSGMGSRRQIVDSNGDGTGNGGDFIKTSHHVYPASGTVKNSDCVVCHDTSVHASGLIRLKNVDTGEVYNYNPANPSTAENHCLSCHDSDGANGNMSPFSDGKALGTIPYKAGKDIKASWNKTYGHRPQGLTCLGNGNPNTGCHSNGHGSTNVGLLARNLTMPLNDWNWYSPGAEPYYDLCFNCHQSYPNVTKEAILGYRLGGNYDINGEGPPPYNIPNIITRFRDRNWQSSGKYYDDFSFYGTYMNLHYFHLQGGAWNYRDMYYSSISCIACHNVHGSDTEWGWVYDEMQYNHYNGEGSDQFGMIGANLDSLSNFPTSCAFNCHTIQGTTYNWFEPSGE